MKVWLLKFIWKVPLSPKYNFLVPWILRPFESKVKVDSPSNVLAVPEPVMILLSALLFIVVVAPVAPCTPWCPWCPCDPVPPPEPVAPWTPWCPWAPCAPATPCSPCPPWTPSAPWAPTPPPAQTEKTWRAGAHQQKYRRPNPLKVYHIEATQPKSGT